MLGENIKFFRNRKGLSQQELSEMLHVSRPTISSWESNRTEPTMGNIEALARVFNCKKSELIGENPTTYAPVDTIMEIQSKEKDISLLMEEAKLSDSETIKRVTQYLRLMRYQTLVDAIISAEKPQQKD